jgi:hypothetical protein
MFEEMQDRQMMRVMFFCVMHWRGLLLKNKLWCYGAGNLALVIVYRRRSSRSLMLDDLHPEF